MSGNHRFDPDRRATSAPASERRSTIGAMAFPVAIALSFAGFSAAVLVAHADSGAAIPAPQPQAHVVVQSQPVSQHGTIVAVTGDSLTARSADGHTQTYRLTPDTTAVTGIGGQSFTRATPFAVNDEVAIHATVTGELATATVVADRAVIGEYGRAMDSQ
ncbi:MAG: hypothetical protein WBB07_22835 [Mycobacterium sp.]